MKEANVADVSYPCFSGPFLFDWLVVLCLFGFFGFVFLLHVSLGGRVKA